MMTAEMIKAALIVVAAIAMAGFATSRKREDTLQGALVRHGADVIDAIRDEAREKTKRMIVRWAVACIIAAVGGFFAVGNNLVHVPSWSAFSAWSIKILSADPEGDTADPDQLPAATGQLEDLTTYGNLMIWDSASGTKYNDPTTGIEILKLGDATFPENNARVNHDYGDGGPHISLPWDSAGATYYTVHVQVRQTDPDPDQTTHYLCNINYDAFTISLCYQLPNMNNNDLRAAFSLVESTPRIWYGIMEGTESVLRKWDLSTSTEVTGGVWPKTFPGQIDWLSVSIGDSMFTANEEGKTEFYAWAVNRDKMHSWAPSGFDEVHIDRNGRYAFANSVRATTGCYGDASLGHLDVFDLSDSSTVTLNPSVPEWPAAPCNDVVWNTHLAGLRGKMVSVNPHEGLGTDGRHEYVYDPLGDSVLFHHDEDDIFNSSGHRAGQWVHDNNGGDLEAQWFIMSGWGGSGHNCPRAVCFVNTGVGSTVRLLAHHYSNRDSYFEEPHATISPDGKLVMWESDMTDSGRIDAFIAKVPTS